MNRNIYKEAFKTIYTYYAALIAALGLVTKFFLTDTNLGERFKGFNHRLLASDISIIIAIILFLVGVLLAFIKVHHKSTLKENSIILSFLLIVPLTFILAITPILETIRPGEIGNSIYGSIFTYTTMIGVFATFVWVIVIFFTILNQLYQILTGD